MRFEELQLFLKEYITLDGLKSIFLRGPNIMLGNICLIFNKNLIRQALMSEEQILDNLKPRPSRKTQQSKN